MKQKYKQRETESEKRVIKKQKDRESQSIMTFLLGEKER